MASVDPRSGAEHGPPPPTFARSDSPHRAASGTRRAVLMVAHTFPPARDVGVRRTAAFARYLPRFGWRPVVLTVRESLPELAPSEQDMTEQRSMVQPETVERTMSSADVVIVRTRWLHPRLIAAQLRDIARRLRSEDPGASVTAGGPAQQDAERAARRHGPPGSAPSSAGVPETTRPDASAWRWLLRTLVLIPDEGVGWIPFALPAALRAVGRYRCTAIYTTSGPPSAHLVGWLVKARTGLPWVADFRDPWTADLSPTRRRIYAFPGRRRLDEWLEANVLRRADKVLAVSEPQLDVLRRAAPSESGAKFEVLTNGFDPVHFEGLEHRPPGPGDPFVLTYTGTLYLEEQSLEALFNTLARIRGDHALPATGFVLRYVGRSGESVLAPAKKAGVDDLVNLEAPVRFTEALRAQVDATALLLVLGQTQGRQGVLTGKLFEYLGAQRPILALVPADSAAADVVRETEAGVVVPADDSAGIEGALRELFAEFESEEDLVWRGNPAAVERYSRVAQTERLAALLDRLPQTKGQSP